MPFFNKIKGAIYSVKFSPKEQKAIDDEIDRQIIAGQRQTEIDSTSTLLWILHDEFGFGKDRLRRVFDLLYKKNVEYETRYLMKRGDGAWICNNLLKEYGVDVEEWFKEERNEI